MKDKIMISLSYDELQKLIMDAVLKMPPMVMPPEVAEIAALRNAEVLTTREVAKLYKVSVDFVERRRMKGTGPKYYKEGKNVRYRLEDVQAYFGSLAKKTIDQE